MKLEYSGQEQIPADADTVWTFVNDPARVANCLPDVVEVKVRDATHFDAQVRVAVGPVRGRFNLNVEMQPDPGARRMNLKIAGGGFGSKVDLTASADIVPASGTLTPLNWRGTAEMRGPVAAVGGRVLDAQAQKLIAQTFANMREKLSV